MGISLYQDITEIENKKYILGQKEKNCENFNRIAEGYNCIFAYIHDPIKKESLKEGLGYINDGINKFFEDSHCIETIFTENTDKMFFGMCVMPIIDSGDNIINSDKSVRIDKYYLELDSKLFTEFEFTDDELVAMTLHEIGHIVNDNSPIERFKKNIANYQVNNGNIKLSNNINYKEILNFGIKDSIRKMDSIFEKTDEELTADEFVTHYGYGSHLQSALEKLIKRNAIANSGIGNKFLVMGWTLRLYQDIRNRRIPALYLLRKMKEISPSFLEKREIQKLEVRLKRIDDDSIIGNYLNEGAVLRGLKYKGIRGYEDDLYEYTMQARNVQNEDDALILMHKINSRMNVIDDYINSEEHDEKSLKRWNNLYDRYSKLREMLSSKTLYKDDYNRIYVNYPQIRDMRNL